MVDLFRVAVVGRGERKRTKKALEFHCRSWLMYLFFNYGRMITYLLLLTEYKELLYMMIENCP